MIDFYNNILHYLMIYIGPAVFIYTVLFHYEKLKINFGAIAKFMAFLLSIYTIKLIIVQHTGYNIIPIQLSDLTRFADLPLTEDAPFVLLPLGIASFFKNKWIQYFIWAVFSVIFALGHVSYGYPWAAVTLLLPYFVSRKYGLRYGFGTTMLAHIIFDVWQTLFVIFLNFITLMGM